MPAPTFVRPELRIDYLPLGQVKRYDKNPKKHDVGALVQSIRRYGFRDAPIFDATLGALVAGHGRLKALDEMRRSGDPVPAGVRENGTDWLVPVQLGVDAKSAAEARAFLLDHNALTVAGGDMGVDGILRLYDQSALGDMLKELAEEQALPVTLDGDDLDELLGVEKPAADAEPQIDRSDELREKWGVKTGQLWRLGDHRLLCGDCTKREDVERLMGGELAALVATDPPYGVDYAAIAMSRVNQKAGGWSAIKSDGLDEDAEVVLRRAMVVAREFCGAGCAVLVWHPPGERAAAFLAALREAGVHVLKQIIWVKPTLVFGRHEYHWRHEPAMYGWFKGSRANFFGERSETTVWEIAPSEQFKVRNGPAMKSGGLGLHPTQKPVELFCRPLRNHTRSGDVALEPFAGSGSQIIAAEHLGRRCFALEIEPKYVAVCIQRWADATGKVPELVDG